MEIDKLITILDQAKKDELTHVRFLRYSKDSCEGYQAERISGYSYNFDENFILLYPEYII